MDIDFARHIIRTAFRTSRDLQDLLRLAQEVCDKQEYDALAPGVAEAIDNVGQALTNKAMAAYPELEGEIDARIDSYGQYF
mgnify:CR=1 FL=1